MSPYEEEKNQGVYYSAAGTKGVNTLVGPAHVLLVDFMVTEKVMAKIIKDLDLPKIDFPEVEKLLKNIQNEIFVVKGTITASSSEDAKKVRIEASRKLIEDELHKVELIADGFINTLVEALKLAANKDKEALIMGAKESIERQIIVLKNDVQKIFNKLQPERNKRSTISKI